jgi:predicted RNA-binding protein with TRAM domain
MLNNIEGEKQVEYYQGDPHKFCYESRGPARSNQKPVEEGKEYDVDVKEVSRRGEGIARVEGFVVFVPNTKMGDHVKVRITKITERFASAVVAQ